MRVGIFILIAAAAAAQTQTGGRGVNLYSVQKEAALGASMAREVRAHTRILETDGIQGYLDGVSGKLSPQFAGSAFPFQVEVTADGDASEPTVLPGGYIFVSAGLVAKAQDEAEFVGLLAHAMAHVNERDNTRLASRGEIAQMATIPLIFMPATFPANGNVMPVALERYWQQFELSADVMGVQAAADSGYDPAGLLRFVQRELAGIAAFPGGVPRRQYEARVAGLERSLAAIPARGYAASDGDFARFQEEVQGLTPARAEAARPRPSLKRPGN